MPRRFQQPYPAEFKAEAVRLVRSGVKPRSEIARELGVTSESLWLWLKQADLDEGVRHDGLTSDVSHKRRRRQHPRPQLPDAGLPGGLHRRPNQVASLPPL